MPRGRRILGVAACSLFALCLIASPALANTITVTTPTDNVPGSLRDAIEKVEPGGTVILPAGIYALTVEQLFVNKSVTITGAGAGSTIITPQRGSRAFLINAKGSSVSISGVTITEGLAEEPGGTANGGGIDDIEAALTLEHCVISNNRADADGGAGEAGGQANGGGIFANGPLHLVDVTLTSNQATANGGSGAPGGIAKGGGVVSAGGATLSAVSFTGNTAAAEGPPGEPGGIAEGGAAAVTAAAGPAVSMSDLEVAANRASAVGDPAGIARGGGLLLTLTGPVGLSASALAVVGNTADAGSRAVSAGGIAEGGGIRAIINAASSIVNATVTQNVVDTIGATYGDGEGGGVWTSGEAGAISILNSTIDNNISQAAAHTGGGGNIQALERIALRDTIVSGGTGPEEAANCAGTIESLGNNLEDRNECGFHAAGDKVGVSPQLGAVHANGGPLLTQAPAQSSPAVDAGASCAPTDERGIARPQGAACDIGAYELALPSATTGAATVTATTATLAGGGSNPDLLAGAGFFQVGLTTAYGLQSAATAIGPGIAGSPFTAVVTGLKPGTVYHYRAVATNPDGIVAGVDATFTTLGGNRAPVLSGLALRPSNLRAQKGHGASLARRRGAALAYKDSQAGTTKLTVIRVRRGFRVGGSCHASRPRHAKGHVRRCTRLVTVGSFSHADKGGAVSAHFTGRVGGHALAPGSYKLRAQARSKAGLASNVLTISFSVVR